MDASVTVAAGIRRLTVNLDSDDVELFEGLWPVPEGVALHAYLVQGTKNLVIDPWDAGGYGPEELAVDLGDLGLGWKDIAAVAFTKAPAADLVDRLRAFHPGLEVWGVPTPGARHDLGGAVVEEREGFWWSSGALFSGDAFAGLGWIEDEVWAEDLGEDQGRYFEDEALRWFGQRPLVPELPEGTTRILPAHGCLSKEPQRFAQRAQTFAAWGQGPGLDEVAVVWPDGAQAGADALVGAALDSGVDLTLFRVPGDDPTALAAAARRSSLVVLAADLDDTFLAGLNKPLWRPRSSAAPVDLRADALGWFRKVLE